MIKSSKKPSIKAGAPKKQISRQTPVASKAHAHLQKVYGDNGFIDYNVQTRMERPQMRYRNHPALIAVVVILALALAVALAYILLPKSYFPFNADNTESAVEDTLDDSDISDSQVPLETDLNTDTSASQPTEPVNTDPTATWQVFTDASSTYSLKYDPAWQLIRQTIPATRYQYAYQINKFIINQASATEMSVSAQVTNKKLKDFLADIDRTTARAWEGRPSVKIENQGDVKIGNLPGYQRWQTLLAADLKQIITYIPVGNKVYSVSVTSQELSQDLVQSYGLLLSTFQSTVATSSTIVSTTPQIK